MKFTNLLFCLLSVSFSAFAQVPTNGLVAYYPFNGNANDETGNGNNGTVHGASLATDRFGKVNSAYSFDGTADIELPTTNLVLSEYSYSFWAQVTPVPEVGSLYVAMSIGGDGGDQHVACDNQYVSSYNGWAADSYYGSGLQYLNFQQSALIQNKWSLITVTRNANSLKLYYDGNLVATDETVESTSPYYGTSNLKAFIGKRCLSTLPFKGLIDDVRIYNRALTEVEVQSLYNENKVNLSLGLVAYYPFNGNANDESGNGNNGTVYGASLAADRFGKVNSAYAYGDLSQYVLCPDVFDYKNRSVSVWFNSAGLTNSQLIYCYDNTGLVYGFDQLELVNNNGVSQLVFKTCDGVQRLNVDVSLNKWHNAVTVFSDGVTTFYLDGVFVGQFQYSSYYTSGEGVNNFVIGSSRLLENGSDQHFIGSIDEVRIYNRALNPAEITALNSITIDSVIAGDVITDKEQIIEIPIYTNYSLSPDNVISYQFDVDYDVTKLEYVGNSTVGTIAEGGSVSVNVASAGKLKVGYMNSSALVGTGNILKLQFKTIDYATTPVQLSNFYFNTKSITNIKNSVVTIADLVSPAADVVFNQVSDTVNMGDILLLTATFTEPMRNSPLPQISFSGAVTLTPTAMVMVNDTVFTYQYVVPKSQGKVLISLGAGKDLYGNTLISTPKTGNSFVIRSISYGDVDDDGKIMAYDAALALQHSVNVSPVDYPLPWKAWRVETANVDGVGVVTANDAALILKYSTGIVSDFPACRSFKEKAMLLNSADVIITLENNELVFRSKGKLFGLNVFYSDSSSLLGKPYILINNVMNIISIEGDKTAIGIATAYAPDENTALIRIPVLSTKSEDLQFCMNINTETTVKSLSTTTGLSDQKVDILKVYPNPVDEILNIEIPSDFKDALISIYAIDGRLVYSQKAGSVNAKVNVDSLAKGVYTVIVTASDKTSATKFIKK